ncbi:MAG: HlyC/CorC family transporter [Nevskiales bacterium]
MDAIPLSYLIGFFVISILLSGFFSGSETGLMSLNRYRLRHLAKTGHKGARFASKLLERPDRLIGLILLLNNVVQALIPMLLLLIAQSLVHDQELAIGIATIATALMIFIFAESMPKTLGAIHPERLAFPAAYVYYPLVRLFLPLLWFASLISNGLLRLIGVSPEAAAQHSLSSEELRTIVAETGAMLPRRHQKMLLSILDLEKITVEDIMVPRNEISGIDIDEPWEKILEKLVHNQHTRLPLWRGSIDDLVGIVHLRRVLALYADGTLTKESMLALAREAYFVPEGTTLNHQLVNFQNQKRRVGFVVDEYGDIQGLIALEDILEEIVGEFTSEPSARNRKVFQDGDGYMVEGRLSLRRLNHLMGWRLPLSDVGPKTVNGLILERMETIPEPGTALKVGDYTFEIAQTTISAVKSVRIFPPKTAKTVKKAAAAAV